MNILHRGRLVKAYYGIGLSLLLLSFVAGCGSGTGGAGGTSLTPRQRSQQTWQKHNTRDYDYTLRLNGFLAPPHTQPVRIAVRNSEPLSVEAVTPREDMEIQRAWFVKHDTIEELFALIAEAEAQKAYEVRVTYDPDFGVPTSIYIDYSKEMADEEFACTVTDIRVMGVL